MLTLTTTTVGVFMYKCGLCPACIGKRLIIWRQQAANRVSHMKKSHILIFFLLVFFLVSYLWVMYPQLFLYARYHAWTTRHQNVVREVTRLRRNLTFGDVCSRECVPDVDSMMTSGYDVPYQSVTETTFTIVTVSRSPEQVLKQFVLHYSQMRRVNKIILYWTKAKKLAPDYESLLGMQGQVLIKYSNATSLLTMFSSLKEIRTDGVLLLEDDVILTRDELYKAYYLWQSHPWGLVGFYGGNHAHYDGEGYRHTMVPFDFYSMVHQGVVFVHKEYIRLYVDKFTSDVTKTGCDDFAINFLVSNHCRCSAAYYVISKSLYIRLNDKLELLSPRWQYNSQNNVCLNYYTNFFGGMPLKRKTCFW